MHTTKKEFSNTIGFDTFLNAAAKVAQAASSNYPPYNVVKVSDDDYEVVIAAAGFSLDNIEITHHNNKLIVAGKPEEAKDEAEFIHQGISNRAFERTFLLHEFVKPTGATFKDGLLTVKLKRDIPDEKKPKTVKVKAA